jgi:hypothetical protein
MRVDADKAVGRRVQGIMMTCVNDMNGECL